MGSVCAVPTTPPPAGTGAASAPSRASTTSELPIRLAVVACVGEDGARAPLREYLRLRAPAALDGLSDLHGGRLRAAVKALAADYARALAAPAAAPRAPPPSAASPPARIAEAALRGISLPQLRTFLAEAGARCVTERWTSRSGEQLTSETMTLYDVAARAIAPLAQRTGLSVVETLARGPQPPAWFVSHWWGEPTADFVRCLEVHSKDRGLDEDATYYWVCAYALRQSALGDELRGGVGVSPFVRAIQLCDGTVSVLDRGAIATSRAWCALELFETTISRGAGYLHDIYTAHEHVDDRREQHERREAVGLVDGFAAADRGDVDLKAFRETHFPLPTLASAEVFALERAEAAQPADLAAILGAVGAEQPLLDATVRARFGVARLRTLICRGADDAALRALLDALRASRLRKVSTGNSSSAPSAAKLALLCASMPPTLEELRLPSALPSVVQPLCEAIEAGRLPRLRTLDLGRCKLGAADVALLSAALASAGCGVVGLDLAFNQLGDEGSSALAGLLEHNTTLTSLDLRHNAVGNKGAAALARSLECNGTLTSLNLRSNKIGDEGAHALAKALERNSVLKNLDLRYDQVSATQAALLAALTDGSGKPRVTVHA